MTLATLVAADGLAEVISAKKTQVIKDTGFRDFFTGNVFGIPVQVIVFALVSALGWVVLNRTTFGRRTYAVGGNPEAARLAGIDVKRHTMFLYVLMGLCCGIAAVLITARTNAGSSNLGIGYELDSIAAVVIGGTLLTGGRGTIVGHRDRRADLLDPEQRVHPEQPGHLDPGHRQGRDHRHRRPAPTTRRAYPTSQLTAAAQDFQAPRQHRT